MRLGTERTVVKAALRAQVVALINRGYVSTTFSRAMHAPAASRWLAVTFDDGERGVFDHAFPTMAELGVPGTAFVSVAHVGAPGKTQLGRFGDTFPGGVGGWLPFDDSPTSDRAGRCRARRGAPNLARGDRGTGWTRSAGRSRIRTARSTSVCLLPQHARATPRVHDRRHNGSQRARLAARRRSRSDGSVLFRLKTAGRRHARDPLRNPSIERAE